MKQTFILIILFLSAFTQFAAAQKTRTQIAQEAADTIVSVNIVKENGSIKSATGFIVNPNGVIATAKHAVKDARLINLTLKNGAVSDEAKVLAVADLKDVDLALLKITAFNLPTVAFGDSDKVQVGEDITVIGNPRRLQNTVTNGLISQLRLVGDNIIWQQISAPISPSSSGSPVFNARGEVVGVALSSLQGADNQNLNFSVPSNYLVELMSQNGYAAARPKPAEKVQYGQNKKPLSIYGKISEHMQKSWRILKKKTKDFFSRK